MYICIFEHMFKIDGGGDRQTRKEKYSSYREMFDFRCNSIE